MSPAAPPVARVLVVVPARDEERRLPRCLAALDRAVAAARTPADVVVVADSCRDRTAAVAAAAGARVVQVAAGSAGAARAAGVRVALGDLAAAPGPVAYPAAVWIACTDADSRVPPGWLRHQLLLAAAGADLVRGTVRLARPPARWLAAYRAAVGEDGHPHVHGANLGVRADRYLAAGGFPDVAVGEDVALVEAVAAAGGRVVATTGEPVLTSGRRSGRAPDGLSGDLRRLAALAHPRGPRPAGAVSGAGR
ncbi:glycosyltransferase family 2 protein [Kineococcus sp. SYSU DK004]|uniref:glycosyltransferase n=1 Tax=Kineococcus sp. SYSU DK004 TaxID=3383125 RepID=UPI003D7D9D62